MGTLSQPGRLGGLITTPLLASRGPGDPIPTPFKSDIFNPASFKTS